MSSRSTVLAIAVCLLAVGLFFLGRLFFSSDADATDEAIVAQAKSEVQEPELPPAPAGSTVTSSQIQVDRVVPIIKRSQAKAGTAAPQGPKTVVEHQNVNVELKVAKATGTNAPEVAAWNNRVALQLKNYNTNLNNKIAQLAREKPVAPATGEMEAALDLIEKGIVPLISAITGLILAIKSLRNPKESPSAG